MERSRWWELVLGGAAAIAGMMVGEAVIVVLAVATFVAVTMQGP
jgi:hypothetical protein